MSKQIEDLNYHSAKILCKRILESNSKVRSVTICQDNGYIMCTEHRKNKKRLVGHAEGQASLVQAAARFFNRRLHEKNFGAIKFSLTLHEKVARIAIPLHDKYVTLISADCGTNHTDPVMQDIYCVLGKESDS